MRVSLSAILLTAALPVGVHAEGGKRMEPEFASLKAVPFTRVKIADSFWAPRQETNRRVSLAHSLNMLEKAGNVRNFELAASGARSGYSGPVFMDSDLYKTLEAVSYSLATHPDPELDRRVDAIIAKISAAQMPDGYLNTHYQVNEPDRRWTNLRDNHELYCAGHLFEAAVAHFQATGKRSLLDVATRFADHIARLFGSGPGQRMGYPGHPEIELALVKLWRATGQQRYFDLARFFVENRGRRFFAEEHGTPPDRYDGTYWQDDVPIYDHRNIKGHAVRAAYLLAGVVDVAAQTRDERLLKMVDRVWRNTTERNTYVTGGIGPSAHNEGFTTDYDLPNRTAYQETCASVAMVFWNHRLNLLYGDTRYADTLERALYNGALAGVSLDGKRFFYVNPLSSAGTHHRSEWFGCACCPPNIARLLASLGGYAYAVSDKAVWVNLYIQGSADVEAAGRKVRLDVTTDYPWDGRVRIMPVLDSPAEFGLRLRVPGWCRSVSLTVNGERPPEKPSMERGYLMVDRIWKTGDAVELNMEMPVERVQAHPKVKENHGKLALQRGPLVYCLEGMDHPFPLNSIALPPDAALAPRPEPGLLGGIVTLNGEGVVERNTEWGAPLYQFLRPLERFPVRAIPYYAWDNRAPGEMEVWLPTTPPVPSANGPESRAKVTVSFQNTNSQPFGINDGIEPKSSGEQPAALCHWWPHRGGEEWVQYTWETPQRIAGSRVYWFDDTGRGACRLPVSWRIEYLDLRDGTWKAVEPRGDFPIALDRWCEARFAPVATKALRLKVQMKPEWAAGIHEWQVLPDDD